MASLRALCALSFAATLSVAVACQVSVVGDPDASASDAGPEDAGDAGGCVVEILPGDRACVPEKARAGAQLTIDVAGTGCGTPNAPCQVTVSGTTVRVAMRILHCPPGDAAPICVMPRAKCGLPALSAGTYTVEVEGEPTGRSPRTMVVTDDGTATSCTLP
jgi:hypothetical protein